MKNKNKRNIDWTAIIVYISLCTTIVLMMSVALLYSYFTESHHGPEQSEKTINIKARENSILDLLNAD